MKVLFMDWLYAGLRNFILTYYTSCTILTIPSPLQFFFYQVFYKVPVLSTYCSPRGLLTFWKSKKKWKYGSTSTVSHPLHNFQPDPQEGVNSKSKVITVSLHPLGKVYQEDWNPTVLSSCRFLVVNFQINFEEKVESSRRKNLKGPGNINNLQFQYVQGILHLIPKVV